MARKKPTVADIRANKGKYQYSMMRVETWHELAAAESLNHNTSLLAPRSLGSSAAFLFSASNISRARRGFRPPVSLCVQP